MPSNQALIPPSRPLTKPRSGTRGSGHAFVAASPLVLRAGRFLTFFSASFLAFSLLFTLRSADDISYYAHAGANKVEGYVGYGAGAGSDAGPCNALRLPGWIEFDAQDGAGMPTWNTLDEQCPASALGKALRSGGGGREAVPQQLRNKTVLLVGDTQPTARRIAALCDLFPGSMAGSVDVAHPWGAALQRQSSSGETTLGSYCYLPSADLLIHHFPHTGLASPLEARLSSLLPSLFAAWSSPSHQFTSPSIPRQRPRASPDLTVFSSYSSDLARWIQPGGAADSPPSASASSSASPSSGITRPRLAWWRKRNVEVLLHLSGLLRAGAGRSRSRLTWMSPGYGDGDAALSLGLGLGLGGENPRLVALAAAQASLLDAHSPLPVAGADADAATGRTTALPKQLTSFLGSARGGSHLLGVGVGGGGASTGFTGEMPWRRVSAGLGALVEEGVGGKGAPIRAEDIAAGRRAEVGTWFEVLLGGLVA